MSIENAKGNDGIFCKTIASSISDIIRFSLDERLRRTCFEVLDVSSLKQTESEINKRLKSLIENENTTYTSKRQCQNSTKNKENTEENTNTLDCRKLEQQSSSGTDFDSQIVYQNTFQRNWLQISSQQYREVVKRRKLNYYSKPILTCVYQCDLSLQ